MPDICKAARTVPVLPQPCLLFLTVCCFLLGIYPHCLSSHKTKMKWGTWPSCSQQAVRGRPACSLLAAAFQLHHFPGFFSLHEHRQLLSTREESWSRKGVWAQCPQQRSAKCSAMTCSYSSPALLQPAKLSSLCWPLGPEKRPATRRRVVLETFVKQCLRF